MKGSDELTPSGGLPAARGSDSDPAVTGSSDVAATARQELPPLGDQRAEATIDLTAITDNVTLLKSRTDALMMAVVKADGYGHGAVPVARAALAGGADWLGVALPSEAVQIREAGINGPILAWLWAPAEDIGAALRLGVTVAVSTLAQLDKVLGSGVRRPNIHLKLDTGLGRGGSSRSEWTPLCQAAAKAENDSRVRVSGLMSHLASAELPDDPSLPEQTAAFAAGILAARQAGLKPDLCHLANSAALLLHPQTHFDMVRCGIAIYGLDPTETYSLPRVSVGNATSLRTAMTLRAQIVLTKRVPAGQGVSYGLTYRTAKETTLALIPLGYADGIPRAASGSPRVLTGGRSFPVVGRIAMDQMVIDVGDAVVMAGDEVIVFGPGSFLASGSDGCADSADAYGSDDSAMRATDRRAQSPSVKDWAIAAGTIDYEIVTRISARVPRGYVSGNLT